MNLHSGSLLDHYRIESLVARSGMASVFRATDTRDGQPVAIKIPHEEMEGDPVLYERFLREAEIGKMLALRAHQKGLELVCEVENAVSDLVVGDSARVRQVLINLIGNAIKFSQRGEVAVTVGCANSAAAPTKPATQTALHPPDGTDMADTPLRPTTSGHL